MPLLSVVVPVFDSPRMLELCLGSVRQSTFTDYELIVSDDGSPDGEGIRRTAERFGAHAIRTGKTSGPAVARNAAARGATGQLLVFLDADCTVHPDTLQRFADAFAADPSLDAVMGSYDLQPRVRGVVASFRNLLHAHVHHRSSRNATTFWTGCGAVRREKFERLGGFDETYRQLEDVEFGMRLHESGGRLALDPEIQVTHHKEWTLLSMLRTDAFDRAMPWTELLFRRGMPRDLSFRPQDRAAALVAVMLPALLFLAFRYGPAWIGALCCAILTLAALQWPLWLFLSRERGVLFAAASFPLYIGHQLAGATGLLLGICRWELARDRWLPWVAAGLAALIFGGVQLGGGAWRAEFDGYPDEAAHFMTGLMVRDYLVHWPPAPPLAFAERYYVHYPKVAFGHWPPLFHFLEAAWWLFLPPARWSAMLLVGLLGFGCAVFFYRIARQLVPPAAAALLSCLLVATPVFQMSAAQTMAETLSLLLALFFLDALVRGRMLQAGLWCILCLMVKGTGAGLVAAPLLLLIIGGQPLAWKIRALGVTILGLLAVSAIYVLLFGGSLTETAGWAGLQFSLPSAAQALPGLAGWGILWLAAGGLMTLYWNRTPVTIAAAAMALSVVISSFFLKAMHETRHWILALPPILLLAAAFVRSLVRIRIPWLRIAAIVFAVTLALASFPWTRYRQDTFSHETVLNGLHRPSRVLVSSACETYEGGWIVMASLREDRPSSVIARATKILARTGWNGGYYRLITPTPAAVQEALDRFGIDQVIVDDRSCGDPPQHHQLLKRALAASPLWRECVAASSLSGWSRISALAAPHQPIRIQISGRPGKEIEER